MNLSFADFYSNLTSEIVYPLLSVLFALALVIFLWGTFKYVKHADNEEERETGKRHMIWGVVGMAIMFSAPAIVEIIRGVVNNL